MVVNNIAATLKEDHFNDEFVREKRAELKEYFKKSCELELYFEAIFRYYHFEKYESGRSWYNIKRIAAVVGGSAREVAQLKAIGMSDTLTDDNLDLMKTLTGKERKALVDIVHMAVLASATFTNFVDRTVKIVTAGFED